MIYNRDPKSVYLLTCIPIEAEITATASWRQFLGTAQNRIGQAILKSTEQIGTITVGSETFEAVVLPFGRELGRCFPGIWPSPDAARDSWRDGGKLNGGRLQIELLFGIAPHLILAYRRPGQRGQPSRALVAIRPTGAAHTPSDGDGGANPTDIRCASTAPTSPATAMSDDRPPLPAIARSTISDDDLRAAAMAALHRIVGPVPVLSIEMVVALGHQST